MLAAQLLPRHQLCYTHVPPTPPIVAPGELQSQLYHESTTNTGTILVDVPVLFAWCARAVVSACACNPQRLQKKFAYMNRSVRYRLFPCLYPLFHLQEQ